MKVQGQVNSTPAFDDPKAWLVMLLTAISGEPLPVAAICCVRSRTERLRPYFDHRALELDHNIAERSMRAIALGRKSYLFVGPKAGGKATAIAYALIETVKLTPPAPKPSSQIPSTRIPDYKITKVNNLMPWR